MSATTSVELTEAERELLARPLHAILTVAPLPGRRPTPRPVWFEHQPDGSVEIITFARAGRVRRIREDPWAAVLVAAQPGEPEHWVSLEGPASIETDGVADVWRRIAGRYWDLGDPEKRATVEGFLEAEDPVRIVVRPAKVARGG